MATVCGDGKKKRNVSTPNYYRNVDKCSNPLDASDKCSNPLDASHKCSNPLDASDKCLNPLDASDKCSNPPNAPATMVSHRAPHKKLWGEPPTRLWRH
ncbi:hypothetical protein ACJMK2_022517 [Sinanodonta woodiana]|uniref:Uncharacterized protein n=1 Tax=Sinanodonta woodiana TaxID=1069815 RepID=A0ABD3TJB8_SINWO